MHILYYHQYFISRDGAGGTRSYENAKALIASGHKVTMVCGHGFSGLTSDYKSGVRLGVIDDINIIQFDTKYSNNQSLPRRALSFFLFTVRSARFVFSLEYDLIFTTSTPLTIGIPGILAKIFRGKYFVFEVRDLWPELPKAMGVVTNPLVLLGMSILEYCTYKSADRLIGLSGGMVEGIVRRGIPKDRVALLPNGCDLSLFDDQDIRIKDSIFSNDNFVVIFAGAHGIANGLDSVLDAAIYISELGEDKIKFLFIGDGKSKPDLIKVAHKKKLGNCTFMPSMPKNNIVRYLINANVGLQALQNIPEFYNGTSPNKFFDYIAVGLPVLNNYPGWISNLIEENNCGVTVVPDDSGAFADELLKISNNRNKLNLMSINAKQLARKSFDRDILAKEWIDWVISK